MPGTEFRSMRADLPPRIEGLVARVPNPARQIEFLRLLLEVGVLEPAAVVQPCAAASTMRPYSWLLARVGSDGMKLTAAGYLPPAVVSAAVDELGMAEEWIGSHNREDQTPPVRELRQSAMSLGLLRRQKGKLLLTPRGRKLAGDPVALWWHVAESVPPRTATPAQAHAGILLLAAAAAGLEDPLEYTARGLWEAGWAMPGNASPDKWMARDVAQETYAPLLRLGALDRSISRAVPAGPTAGGALFARTALRAWPPDDA